MDMWNQGNREYRVLIVQENEHLSGRVAQSLGNHGFTNTRETCNAHTALSLIRLWKPDFVLLDTHLGGQPEGFRLAKKLDTEFCIPFVFICVKIDTQQTKEIIDCKPSGILLHPMNELQFIVTLNRMIESHSHKDKQLMDLLRKERILHDEIMYLHADGNYWEVITSKGKKLVRKSYNEIISSFPENKLQRIHRSYIVNRNAVAKYSSSKVQLINGLTLPISRSFQQELRNIG